MQKDPIEAMCRKAGLAPARRETMKGRDVFVADEMPRTMNFDGDIDPSGDGVGGAVLVVFDPA